MLRSLRHRLIALSLSITLACLICLSAATIVLSSRSTLAQVDEGMDHIVNGHAQTLAAWVADKQRITSGLARAVGEPDDIALRMAAMTQQAGGFDDA